MVSDIIREFWAELSDAAQRHIVATRPHLLNEWKVMENGYCYDVVSADNVDAALDLAVANFDESVYESERTLWVRIWVCNAVTGETAYVKVTVDPTAPKCTDGHEHAWDSPYSVLGGCKENPGVWGHGGGVIIRMVCSHCGTYRECDTWGQDPETGEQGLDSIEYLDADERSLEYVESLKSCA